jgi:hypothetical protein
MLHRFAALDGAPNSGKGSEGTFTRRCESDGASPTEKDEPEGQWKWGRINEQWMRIIGNRHEVCDPGSSDARWRNANTAVGTRQRGWSLKFDDEVCAECRGGG